MERIPTISDGVDEYLRSWAIAGHSVESCRARGYLLTPLRALDASVIDIDYQLCARLILERRQVVKANSVSTFAKGLSAFCTFCVEQGWLAVHPMKNMKRPKAPEEPHRYLSQRQCRALWAACRDDYERLALVLMANCGLRISEVIGLRWERIDWEEETFELLGKGPDGGKWRALDAAPAIPLLASLPRTGPTIFPFGTFALRCRIQRVGRDAGLPFRIKPHELRHTYAVEFLEASEEDAFTLQQALGHSDPTQTEHYVRAVKERAAVRKMKRVRLRLFEP